MTTVTFTRHLERFFPDLEPFEVEGATVRDVLLAVEARHEGLLRYVLEDSGALRQHVNIFVDNVRITDRHAQQDEVGVNSTVFIMQALSGG